MADGDVADEREWMATAITLDAENRELRRALTSVLFWVFERRELFEFARAEVSKRWPEDLA